MSPKHKPKLGQNFLSDLAARTRIVEALGDLSQATVLEIGPGHGALTDLLAARARHVIAVELDRTLVPELRFHFRNQGNVEVVEADILSTNLASLLLSSSAALQPNEAALAAGVPIVGNLPYYITSDILLHLFRSSRELPGLLSSAVLMMQREVAERVASPPGRRDFGLLSATAQMHAQIDLLFTLGPASFSPPPEVDSSVVRLRFHPRFTELGVDAASFDRFLHQAFAQKRKTLAKNLRHAGFTPDQILSAWPASLASQIRAEAVPLEDLAALHRGLVAGSAKIQT